MSHFFPSSSSTGNLSNIYNNQSKNFIQTSLTYSCMFLFYNTKCRWTKDFRTNCTNKTKKNSPYQCTTWIARKTLYYVELWSIIMYTIFEIRIHTYVPSIYTSSHCRKMKGQMQSTNCTSYNLNSLPFSFP